MVYSEQGDSSLPGRGGRLCFQGERSYLVLHAMLLRTPRLQGCTPSHPFVHQRRVFVINAGSDVDFITSAQIKRQQLNLHNGTTEGIWRNAFEHLLEEQFSHRVAGKKPIQIGEVESAISPHRMLIHAISCKISGNNKMHVIVMDKLMHGKEPGTQGLHSSFHCKFQTRTLQTSRRSK